MVTDFFEDATDAAILRICDLFKHPDDLANKLAMVRKKFQLERASIDAQLKTAMELQLDDANLGLETLKSSMDETMVIRANLLETDKLCANAKNTIENYEQIKLISKTHRNFITTKNMVEQFQKLNSQVNRIQGLLDDDLRDILGPADNLLLIHYHLFKLQEFRGDALKKARGSGAEAIQTLSNYFRKVDVLEESFDMYFWSLVRHIVDLAKKGHSCAIVRIVKIIETEERADEEESVKEAQEHDSVDPNDELVPKRHIKSYRIKCIDVLREEIGIRVEELLTNNRSDLTKLLAGCDGFIDDLVVIHDDLEPCFPKRYNIFQFFVLEYHRNIYDLLNKVVSGPMEGGAILKLLKWVRDYYDSMSGRLGVGEELLEPRLLDGREEALFEDYIRLVRTKLAEWLENLLSRETQDFLRRQSAPETENNGTYLLSGSVIVFQMFNQQVDIVMTSSRGPLMFDVIAECCEALDRYGVYWGDVADREFQRFCEKDPELGEGLPDYLVALANDCLRSTEFADTMSGRVEGLLDEPFKTQALSRIKQSSDSCMKLAKKCYTLVISIISLDLKPALVQMHCPAWYEQNLMLLITATLDDYLTDFQERMAEYLFSKFVTDMMDQVVLLWIETLRNKSAKFKMAVAIDKMKSDIDSLILTLSKFKTAKRVKTSFEVVEKIIGFIESNPRMVFLDFYSLYRSYPDVPLSFIESVLFKRDDLDKATIKEVMENCKTKVKEENRVDFTPTVFSRLSPAK
ncbi:exocyst complex component Sec6-domain-containing protein [Polychytrium aggregatum]|uniref:exocyst complex component Sec6-domain-containing protein n=1 Tax=Polychytrium aggregatum TaxID=110093 RepID=UPI0022FF1735|nr:exocyst complex component Sec6-domain-containing protein [Polychytrium aggregatum]KAI9193098.1 exocyst complex component Sec6-domain-containing protein [Polychytrium aggregatum]